jgi:tetratricopeptide (TPR) repeat protein
LAAFDERGRWASSYAEALALHRQGHVADALARYDRLVSGSEAATAQLHNNRGIALPQLGRPREALASYASAIRLDARDPDPLVNQGVVLGDLGRFAEALASFERALRLRPDHATAQRYATAVRAALSDGGAEKSRVERALDEAMVEAAAGRPEAAIAHFDQAIAGDPGCAAAHGNRATALGELGRWPEALDGYVHACALEPEVALFHARRGRALHALARPAEVLAAFARAIALDPGDDGTHFGVAEALLAVSRWGDAASAYRRARDLDPGAAAVPSASPGRWSISATPPACSRAPRQRWH